MLFVIICFSIGLLCRHFIQFYTRIPLPYTLVLMMIGICMGLLPLSSSAANTAFVRGMISTANMEPTLLLHIFIPGSFPSFFVVSPQTNTMENGCLIGC
jgi:hypothetical protein